MDARKLDACFIEAARPAFERLDRDTRRAGDVRVGKFLGYLREHLFDPDFGGVRGSFRALGLRDNNLSTLFRTKIGELPSVYVSHRRLETALRLLCEPGIPVWQAGNLVGFQSNHGFSQAFRRYCGVTPRALHKLAQSVIAVASHPRLKERVDEILTISPTARQTLLRWLGQQYPAFRALVPEEPSPVSVSSGMPECSIPLDLITDAVARELPSVRKLWKSLRELPFDQQVDCLVKQGDFKSPALFYWIREASREASRSDRERGRALAELALVSVRLLELSKMEFKSEYRALAWTWLGNLRRLLLDFTGAVAAFEAAQIRMPENVSKVIYGEWCYWKAHLEWYQRKLPEAQALADEAIAACDIDISLRLHCEGRIFRGIVSFCRDKYDESIADLQEALHWLDPEALPEQCFAAHYQLVRSHLALGNRSQATHSLADAKRHRSGRSRFSDAALDWLSGLVALENEALGEAEAHLLQARLDLLEIRRSEHVAVLALDLAVLYARQGALDKAVLIVAEAVPVLERLSFADRTEISRALHAIRSAAKKTAPLDRQALEELRNMTQKLLRSNPAFVLDEEHS